MIKLDGRKVSSESLGLSGNRVNSSSPRMSELDENEPHVSINQAVMLNNHSHGIAPFLNKSNNHVQASDVLLNHVSSQQHQKILSPATASHKVGFENQENTSSSVLTPRQNSNQKNTNNSSSTSSNMVFSLKKAKQITDRKNRIMACNKDSLAKHVEIMNRAKLR